MLRDDLHLEPVEFHVMLSVFSRLPKNEGGRHPLRMAASALDQCPLRRSLSAFGFRDNSPHEDGYCGGDFLKAGGHETSGIFQEHAVRNCGTRP